MSEDFRCGFAALVGRPNVGKSTLLNALIGQKLSIVTPRPQTTRHRVLGLHENESAQIAFVDTPGIHHGGKRALNRAMNRTAATVLADVDVCVFVVEALQWTHEDDLVLEHLVRSGRPAMIAGVNKSRQGASARAPAALLAELAHRHAFAEIVPISATKKVNLAPLISAITELLPVSPPLFPTGQVTDRDLAFRIAEMIREKLTLELDQELPYGIAVEIEAMGHDEGQLKSSRPPSGWTGPVRSRLSSAPAASAFKRVGRKARLELNDVLGERLPDLVGQGP